MPFKSEVTIKGAEDVEETYFALETKRKRLLTGKMGGCDHEPGAPCKDDCPQVWADHLAKIQKLFVA